MKVKNYKRMSDVEQQRQRKEKKQPMSLLLRNLEFLIKKLISNDLLKTY